MPCAAAAGWLRPGHNMMSGDMIAVKFSPETIEKASTLTSAAWPEKTRVYTLAKNLGFSSREMIDLLAVLQISKRAQSNVSPTEITAVLDHIASAEAKQPAKKETSGKKSAEGKPTEAKQTQKQTADKKSANQQPAEKKSEDQQPAEKKTAKTAGDKDEQAVAKKTTAKEKAAKEKTTKKAATKKAASKKAESKKAAKETTTKDVASDKDAADKLADEKLRHRVRKNVENEINQIAQKVDAEITASAVEAPSGEVANAENSNQHGSADEPEDVTAEPAAAPSPDVPAPAEPTMNAYVPVFRAPDVPEGISESEIDDIVAFTEQAEDATGTIASADARGADAGETSGAEADIAADDDLRGESTNSRGRRRRRGRRGGARGRGAAEAAGPDKNDKSDAAQHEHAKQERNSDNSYNADNAGKTEKAGKSGKGAAKSNRDDKDGKHEHVEKIDEPRGLRGSSRLEAQRRRRNELREETRKTERIVSASEFQERRDAITRKMIVCERPRIDGPGTVTQLGLLEDDVLVEHFVNADNQGSIIGNIYLGRVENVLRNMEAAFIDIGQGRNAVLYAGEVDWKARGLNGRQRRIEAALKPGDQVLVQVIKDPLGHKGARLTAHISFSGRYLVYVPGGHNAGISRKLPAPERSRLKEMLDRVVPDDGGTIIRTAAEGVPERAIAADVDRMHNQWLHIKQRVEEEKESQSTTPVTLFEEPDMLVKVVRDLFNEDYSELIVDGDRAYSVIYSYVKSIAPDLLKRIKKHDASKFDGKDSFTAYHIDEQIESALSRHVSLPSGGSLVIDRTEAMIVIDVNTGKFTGKRKGGNLEETVTRNNLEAVDEIVRQIRLRDLGGMIVMDFIDMVLEENQDLVLRRLKERLTQDRSRYQVSEVTSLGLVQMTRKRIGTGLLEAYGMECPTCAGRGVVINSDPVDAREQAEAAAKTHHQEPENGYGRDRVSTTSDEALDDVNEQAAGRVGRGERAGHAEDDRQRASAEEFESLAASVIGAQHTEAQPESESQSQHAAAADEDADRDAATAKSGRRRRSKKPRVKHGDEAPRAGEQSYEQAVEEFEASPRRRRRTRGNSRSDHRPRPEDFRNEDRPGEEQTRGTESEGKAAVHKSAKRRRVVRRVSAARNDAAAEQRVDEQSGAQAGGAGAQSVDKKQRRDDADGVVRKSTRRRRVVRKPVKK